MELSGNYKVYKHTFPNGKIYIGITKQKLNARFGKDGKGYSRCPRMWKAIQKYGWDNVKHELLFDNLDLQSANSKEIELIRKYKSNNEEYGYNLDNGGNCKGSHSEITRKKISDAQKGIKHPRCTDENKAKYSKLYAGQGNPFYGKKHSKETIDKISKSRLGNKWSVRKPIIQFTLEGILVAEYETITDAHNKTGISMASLSSACSGKYKKAGGYIWKYKEV